MRAVDRKAPGLDVDGEPFAVFALEEDLVDVARPSVGDALLERTGAGAELVAVDVLVDQDVVVAVAADDVGGGVARDVLGALAPVHDLALVVGDVDALGDGVDQVGEEAVEGAPPPDRRAAVEVGLPALELVRAHESRSRLPSEPSAVSSVGFSVVSRDL